MSKGRLPEEAKRFIVENLACFDSPSTVAKAVYREFGVQLTRQHVEKYDPTKRAGRNLSRKLKVIFEATREGFIADTKHIGWAHRSTRLRMIQRVGEKAEEMGNLNLVLQAVEQAAKEEGDHYGNTRKLEHTSPDGSMSPRPLSDFYPDPPEDGADG